MRTFVVPTMMQTYSRIYKRKGYDITVEKSPVTGMLLLSTVTNGRLVTHRYFDYTIKEALELFLTNLESKQ